MIAQNRIFLGFSAGFFGLFVMDVLWGYANKLSGVIGGGVLPDLMQVLALIAAVWTFVIYTLLEEKRENMNTFRKE